MQLHAAIRDLTDPAQQARVLHLADELVVNPDLLDHVVGTLHAPGAAAHADPIEIEAAACASSAIAAQAIASPVHVSIVWPMHGETNRIRRADQHARGQDFLFEKVRQIQWLADYNSLLTWDLVAVDDGCPNHPSSADIATELVFGAQIHNRVTVLRLGDAIGRRLPVSAPFQQLGSTENSRKGGAIAYGMWAAVSGRAGTVPRGAEHVVIYTDAGISTNLAQAAPLMFPVLNGAAGAAGQRYGMPGAVRLTPDGPMTEPASTATNPDRAIILFRKWVQAILLPDLANIVDVQAGFKAFHGDVVADALPRLGAFCESFDAELLLHAVDVSQAPLIPVPIVFTEHADTANLSGTSNVSPTKPSQRHLDMLVLLVDLHDQLDAHRRFHPNSRPTARALPTGARSLRTLLRRLDLESFSRIISRLDHELDIATHDFTSEWTVTEIAAYATPS